MFTKEEILKEILKEAKNNNSIPLGTKRFEEKTGIKPYDWQKYWPRFGDAQQEAGFSPNKFLKTPYEDSYLLEKFIFLMRELKKWPTKGEIVVKHNANINFPDDSLFYNRFGTKTAIAQKVLKYATEKKYLDIVKICQKILEKHEDINELSETFKENRKIGFVYLAKSGPDYKIGRTIEMDRRSYEIGIKLPNGFQLIHEIKTDDPEGVEAYWHKRFASKRKRGEWFSLKITDVKAFKRWRRIV